MAFEAGFCLGQKLTGKLERYGAYETGMIISKVKEGCRPLMLGHDGQ